MVAPNADLGMGDLAASCWGQHIALHKKIQNARLVYCSFARHTNDITSLCKSFNFDRLTAMIQIFEVGRLLPEKVSHFIFLPQIWTGAGSGNRLTSPQVSLQEAQLRGSRAIYQKINLYIRTIMQLQISHTAKCYQINHNLFVILWKYLDGSLKCNRAIIRFFCLRVTCVIYML